MTDYKTVIETDFTIRSNRMKAAARIRDLENELAEARAQYAARDHELSQCVLERDEARAQIAELKERVHYAEGTADAQIADRLEREAKIAELHDWADSLLQKIEVLEARVEAKDAALREGSSQWLLDAVANWKKRAEEAEALVTEVDHMRESLAWYAKREADLLARIEAKEERLMRIDAALREIGE